MKVSLEKCILLWFPLGKAYLYISSVKFPDTMSANGANELN